MAEAKSILESREFAPGSTLPSSLGAMDQFDLASLPAKRGVYTAERASQLSGVPKSTIYYWAREPQLVVPSVSPEKIKLWSYRDLILLRFVAWLRSNGVSPADVGTVTGRLANSMIDLRIRTGMGRVFGPTVNPASIVDLLNNQTALGDEIAGMLPEFELAATEIDGLGKRRLWGPNLISPSERTRIHPDVLSGEPYVNGSRIPTAALFALTKRGLSAERIAELYEIDSSAAAEAIWLERSIEAGEKLPAAA